jgi:accessory gene regulator protein AgrB
MNIKRVIMVISLSAVFASVAIHTTYADSSNAGGFATLASYQNSTGFTQAFQSKDLPAYINNVFKIVLSIGGILAVLRIAYAGYIYMGSADMWGNKQHAKEMLADAIIGLLLLFGIYLILDQINPNLLNLDILKNIHQTSSINTGGTQCGYSNIPCPSAQSNFQPATPETSINNGIQSAQDAAQSGLGPMPGIGM